MQTKHDIDGSTRFHKIGDVEFWLTATNSLFLKRGETIIHPSLNGSHGVHFDQQPDWLTSEVTEYCRKTLRKQRDIRANWPTPAEDKEAWTFN